MIKVPIKDIPVLIIWHWRLFGLHRGTRILLNHVPAIRRWFEAPSRRTRRACRGLADEAGMQTATEILAALDYGALLVTGMGGRKIVVRPGSTDARVFMHMFGERPYLVRFPWGEPNLILDCGANVGYSALLFARHYPNARIIAIEPEEENYRILCHNTEEWHRIRCLNAAVWSSEEILHIANPGAASWAFQVARGSDGDKSVLHGLTIDALTQEIGETAIDIVKIDIEGAEKELFAQGAPAWLERTKILFIELHDYKVPGCSAAFYGALAGLPFFLFHDGETVIALNIHHISTDRVRTDQRRKRCDS